MKKIGIATLLNDSTNYGGCLQAYALCKVLNDMGHDTQQILYRKSSRDLKKRIISVIKGRRILNTILNRSLRLLNLVLCKIFKAGDRIRDFNNSFPGFKDRIPHTDIVYDEKTIYQCNQFDIYITGSDQVWNVEMQHGTDPFYWLEFVPDSKKRISYAASISLQDLPEELFPSVRRILSGYHAISVREKSDKELIDRIMDKDISEWVADPTLLLDKDEWCALCQDNSFKNKKYIFAYILGDSSSQRKTIERFAKEKGFIIITIPYLLGQFRKCDKNFGDIRISECSPGLWLSLIRDAQFVMTDSFHGCVFSSIFHTPFFAFKRNSDSEKNNMNSRLYSLFSLFRCEHRLVSDTISANELSNTPSIDFSRIDNVIKQEKQKALEFLRETIEES